MQEFASKLSFFMLNLQVLLQKPRKRKEKCSRQHRFLQNLHLNEKCAKPPKKRAIELK